jgi:hypothetical protein
MLFNKLQ